MRLTAGQFLILSAIFFVGIQVEFNLHEKTTLYYAYNWACGILAGCSIARAIELRFPPSEP